MVRRKKKHVRMGNKPSHPLKKVQHLAKTEQVYFRGNALRDAQHDFGWRAAEILDAITKLRECIHFVKTAGHEVKKGAVMLDAYRARGINGENIYTHLYIDPKTGKLIIDSFKKL